MGTYANEKKILSSHGDIQRELATSSHTAAGVLLSNRLGLSMLEGKKKELQLPCILLPLCYNHGRSVRFVTVWRQCAVEERTVIYFILRKEQSFG
jgi:hypothetical protein